MSGPALNIPAVALQAEWERLQMLAFCLARSREGKTLTSEHLDQLRELQHRVERLRLADGPWQGLLPAPLSPVELDALVCIVAPEIEPRIGWAYQSLQAGSGQPWASRALIQELLALEPDQAAHLQRALADASPLQRYRLLRETHTDPYQPLRPAPWFTSRLQGMEAAPPAPVGAVPVTVEANWDDLILPPDRIAMLHEYLLWIRHRVRVEDEWGGTALGGPVALFAGASGTGKTLAASVLASELGWPLYRVDLGRLVSKYIGETEKNLNALFDSLHDREAVLQFDEADALFARRGEVKEARDRYANMEVSHLLSRIERHRGPCILTTNLRKQIDGAFTRRFQMVVEFPRPDAGARARLWDRLLPPRAPRHPEVDTAALGRSVVLTGGGIRNAALHAAYLSAHDDEPIRLRHIAIGVWRELGKEHSEASPAELGALQGHLPEEIHHAHH